MSEPTDLPPPPLSIRRQIATGVVSPITLSREESTASSRSDIRHPDEIMRERLLTYKTYLEHEIQFTETEIRALIERPPSLDPVQQASFEQLRDNLKVRYNGLSAKLPRVLALLEVMD
jgi:hypothetical protein